MISDTEISAQQEVGPAVLKVENQTTLSAQKPNDATYSGSEFTEQEPLSWQGSVSQLFLKVNSKYQEWFQD